MFTPKFNFYPKSSYSDETSGLARICGVFKVIGFISLLIGICMLASLFWEKYIVACYGVIVTLASLNLLFFAYVGEAFDDIRDVVTNIYRDNRQKKNADNDNE